MRPQKITIKIHKDWFCPSGGISGALPRIRYPLTGGRFLYAENLRRLQREQKMQYFADFGGGEGGLSPLLRSVNGQNTIKKNQNS